MFSFSEIIFLCLLALVLIGPKQLPEVARNIARFINEMRRASSGLFDEFKLEMQDTKKQMIGNPVAKLMDEAIKPPKEKSGEQNV